jgi:hypothetical protein
MGAGEEVYDIFIGITIRVVHCDLLLEGLMLSYAQPG